MENLFRWRSQIVAHLSGHILEIGVGAGPNLPHYRTAASVHGNELNAELAMRAHRLSRHVHVPASVEIARAEELPYADDSFDHVVGTLVLCSVHDQHQVLQELRRVLKPDGVLHMVEHVRPSTPLLSDAFRLLSPYWQRVAGNCHLDRPTLAVLTESGWDVQVQRRLFMFVKAEARPAPAPRFSGIAGSSNQDFYR